MWATSFSDFAKKAQEASELAARTAHEASSSMNHSMKVFNLDSMIDQGDNQVGKEDEQQQQTSTNNNDNSNDENDSKIGNANSNDQKRLSPNPEDVETKEENLTMNADDDDDGGDRVDDERCSVNHIEEKHQNGSKEEETIKDSNHSLGVETSTETSVLSTLESLVSPIAKIEDGYGWSNDKEKENVEFADVNEEKNAKETETSQNDDLDQPENIGTTNTEQQQKLLNGTTSLHSGDEKSIEQGVTISSYEDQNQFQRDEVDNDGDGNINVNPNRNENITVTVPPPVPPISSNSDTKDMEETEPCTSEKSQEDKDEKDVNDMNDAKDDNDEQVVKFNNTNLTEINVESENGYVPKNMLNELDAEHSQTNNDKNGNDDNGDDDYGNNDVEIDDEVKPSEGCAEEGLSLDTSLASPLSKHDISVMSFSMTRSAERCDSEKDLDDNDDNDDVDDIDQMYDDDESEVGDEGDIENSMHEIDQSVTSEASKDVEGTHPIAQVPQFAIEKFMSQLERLHEQHEGELREMEKKHHMHVGEMKEQLDVATARQTVKNDVVEQDKFLSQLRTLEKDFNDRLKQKDEQISNLVDINKLMEDQITELKNESDGLNKSLNARNEMLSQMKEKETEIESLKASLEKTKNDLDSSNEAFTTLKGRVKTVATELKDRRVECRNLNINVQELTLTKSKLESENKDMSTKYFRSVKQSEERGTEIESLQKSATDLKHKLNSKEKELLEKGSVGDKALNNYKKKAQSLLATANARAAAANQARDDAETDSNNARVEAEKFLKRARNAEKEKQEVVDASLKEVNSLNGQVEEIRHDRDRLVSELATAQTECLKAFEDVKETQAYRESLLEELNDKDDELAKEIEKNSGLEQDLTMATIKINGLDGAIVELNADLEKAKSAAFIARQKETDTQNINNTAFVSGGLNQPNNKDDANIVMLQQELQVANDVIKDLKESLSAIISKDPSTLEPEQLIQTVNSMGEEYNSSPRRRNIDAGSNNDSTPLFFAFEKQAELNTARDEITRLAALLGDAESEKMEALEAKEIMRKVMEETESRLKRFEKLGAAGGHRHFNGSTHTRRVMGQSNFSLHQGSSVSSHNDSSMNLEYLKNIMLRYMNAMSLNEKKALIPVIGAVLELTADEQAQAINSVEKNAGIQGVGTTLIENVQNKGFVSGLFGDLM